MNPLEALGQQAVWAARNTAYNLKFIPEDKLNWKPAPTANSALEVVNHVAPVFTGIVAMFKGEQWAPPTGPSATNLKEAQDVLVSNAEGYAAYVRTLTPADLEGDLQFPWGPMPKKRAISLPMIDMIHHHGQIAYIQTLLGDTDMHFEEMGT